MWYRIYSNLDKKGDYHQPTCHDCARKEGDIIGSDSSVLCLRYGEMPVMFCNE